MDLTYITGLAAAGVVAVHEILKLKIIPLTFANRYPVPTNIALSVVAAVIAVWKSNVVQPTVWTGWVSLVATIAVLAAIIYNQLIKNWTELREMEG